MLKNLPNRREARQRKARAKLAARIVAAYRFNLARLPAARLRLKRIERAERKATIRARRGAADFGRGVVMRGRNRTGLGVAGVTRFVRKFLGIHAAEG